jgi:hypothetical protein
MMTKIRIDSYTKIILTIIALCLMWICLRDIKIFPNLYAANSEIVDVRIKAVERTPGENWEPFVIEIFDNLPVEVKNIVAIPIEVKNELLPVDVKDIAVKSVLVPIEVKK